MTPVALHSRISGFDRIYTVLGRQGQVLATVKVSDSGQGAAAARSALAAKGYAATSAEWAYKITRKFDLATNV